MRRIYLAIAILLMTSTLAQPGGPTDDPRLKNAFRKPLENSWIFVHLQGSPQEIGFQHGYLLAPEISDAFKVISLELTHDNNKDWQFFREAARNILWPHVELEYHEELRALAAGLNARGVKMDIWDVVALNAFLELPYYVNWLKKQDSGSTAAEGRSVPERCSAFVATGSYTKDGKVVMGHNAWTGYMDGERWNIIFDIVPQQGYRILMDGFPGLIHSADDFGMNSAGILITETTISNFSGWNSDGNPEFARARKAMQYSASIDDFARFMKTGNNGGYANTWLVANRNTNEIASLELGLKNVNLRKTKDGYFCGANFPVNENLIKEETEFPIEDMGVSANARRVRWEQLMAEYKGNIDVAAGQKFLADHWDSFDKKENPNERSLCGHVDLSPRGMKGWQEPYGIAGAVQAKVTDAAMAEKMSLSAAMGHPCGIAFKASQHLRQYPQFSWQKKYLRDLNSYPWTVFTIAK